MPKKGDTKPKTLHGDPADPQGMQIMDRQKAAFVAGVLAISAMLFWMIARYYGVL